MNHYKNIAGQKKRSRRIKKRTENSKSNIITGPDKLKNFQIFPDNLFHTESLGNKLS